MTEECVICRGQRPPAVRIQVDRFNFEPYCYMDLAKMFMQLTRRKIEFIDNGVNLEKDTE